MIEINIDIIKFTDNSQPGWVLCSFMDAHGEEHFFEEKIPILTAENLNEKSQYPTLGVIRGEIVGEFVENGKAVVTIDFTKPWGISSQEGIFVFDIYKKDTSET